MQSTPRAQVFSKDQVSVALRTALRILEKWQATTEQVCSILSLSSSNIAQIQQGKGIELGDDQLKRASIVLNCHASLRLVFEDPENVYGFVSKDNHNEFFNGRKPLEIMAQGDLISMLETYKRIDILSDTRLQRMPGQGSARATSG